MSQLLESAYSGESGHRFRREAGHRFRCEAGHLTTTSTKSDSTRHRARSMNPNGSPLVLENSARSTPRGCQQVRNGYSMPFLLGGRRRRQFAVLVAPEVTAATGLSSDIIRQSEDLPMPARRSPTLPRTLHAPARSQNRVQPHLAGGGLPQSPPGERRWHTTTTTDYDLMSNT